MKVIIKIGIIAAAAILIIPQLGDARGSRQNAPRVDSATTGAAMETRTIESATDRSAYDTTGTNSSDTTMTPDSGTGMRDDQILGDRTRMPTGRVKARDIEKRTQDNTARDRTNSSGSEGTGAGTGTGPISE